MAQRHHRKAYTMIEILLTIAIAAVLAAMTISALASYQRAAIIDAELQIMASVVQRARQKAISNDSSSNYSITFLTDSYVMYPGSTYSNSNPDNKEYDLDTGVIVSTTFAADTLTFENFTGRAVAGGEIVISAFGRNKEVVINSLGIVESIT